jgi:hypothetical protein
MQLFGLHTQPCQAALRIKAWVHVNSQARETTQQLYTALHIHKHPITGCVQNRRDRYVLNSKKERISPYKPFSASHPISLQAAASQAHFKWALRHAMKLCKLWAKKSRNGKKHMCLVHLRHIQYQLEKFGFPESMPETITSDEWLHKMGAQKSMMLKGRIATKNPPAGCSFGILGMEDEYHVTCLNADGVIERDWIASYNKYYEHKLSQSSVARLGTV